MPTRIKSQMGQKRGKKAKENTDEVKGHKAHSYWKFLDRKIIDEE